MNKLLASSLLALASLGLTATAHAEGDSPRVRAKQAQLRKAAARAAEKIDAEFPFVLQLDPPPVCPDKDADWVVWRDGKIDELLSLKPVSEPYLDLEDVMNRSSRFTSFLDLCASTGHTPPEAVLANFSSFIRAQDNANYVKSLDHQFGHRLNDLDYLQRIKPQVTLPCLLRSPEFLRNISDPAHYYDAFKLIDTQNHPPAGLTQVAGCQVDGQEWKVLIYRSHFLTTPDEAETFGRFFVLVPGKNGQEHDRWIQFGIWLPDDGLDHSKSIQNVSVVAVAQTKDPRAEGRFDAAVDWYRVPKEDCSGELTLKFRREIPPNHETDNCLRCHKTIPVGIHPAGLYEFVKDQLTPVAMPALKDKAVKPSSARPAQAAAPLPADVVADLSRYIRANVNYRRPPVYDIDASDAIAKPDNYGPAFGPDADNGDIVRTPASVQACTAGLNPGSVQSVIANMNCAQCHNGALRRGVGMLNFPLATEKRIPKDKGSVPNIIYSHILGNQMPINSSGQGPNLSQPEREALYNCLSKEYFDPAAKTGLFVDWLKGKSSSVPVASPVFTSAATTAPKPKKLVPTKQAKVDAFAVCLKCHDPATPKDAPLLAGVFMRPLASVAGYDYSPDMKAASALRDAQGKPLVWDEANLMEFLKDTNAFLAARLGHAADSDMAKRYADEDFRRTVVEHLKTLK